MPMLTLRIAAKGKIMNSHLLRLLFLLATASIPDCARGADVWTGFRDVVSIQVIETGGFLITFSTPLPAPCSAAGTSTLYIYPGQNTVTASGLSILYAAAMTALTTDKQISVMYDNSTTNCFGRYITITK